MVREKIPCKTGKKQGNLTQVIFLHVTKLKGLSIFAANSTDLSSCLDL